MSEREPNGEGVEGAERPELQIDLRRLTVAARRFEPRVDEGIVAALRTEQGIDTVTARVISHVLGRGLGGESALAEFGRSGEGNFEDLRDEYLALYLNPSVPVPLKAWIDWLALHALTRDQEASDRQFQIVSLPPDLSEVLVSEELAVAGEPLTIFVKATTTRADLDALAERLQVHGSSPALEGFLRMSSVDATSDGVLEQFDALYAGSYPNAVEALRALSPVGDWEDELIEWQIDHGIETDALVWNYEPLLDRLRGIYDLVEWKGAVHAFTN